MNDELNFRIATLMDERGLKPYPFAKSVGIASSTMTSIYKGKVKFKNISIDVFLKIAHGLGMTAEELYYGEEEEEVDDSTSKLTNDEQTIIDGYRAMDDGAKHRIRRNVRNELEDMDYLAREKKEAI